VFQIHADTDHAIYLNADPAPDPGFALALCPDPFLCSITSRKVRPLIAARRSRARLLKKKHSNNVIMKQALLVNCYTSSILYTDACE
jgi:hypothetical protein